MSLLLCGNSRKSVPQGLKAKELGSVDVRAEARTYPTPESSQPRKYWLPGPLSSEGAQMLPEGDQSWRISPLIHEAGQDDQINQLSIFVPGGKDSPLANARTLLGAAPRRFG
jgi:hypothetical protein